MADPPKNIPPSELFQLLSTMPRAHRMVPFPRCIPGTDEPIGMVAIWPLREGEIIQAQAAAKAYMSDSLKIAGGQQESESAYEKIFNNVMATEMLQRACRRTKKNQETGEWEPELNLPMFLKASDIRANVTHDEIGVLFNSYVLVQREIGPIVNELSKAECESWQRVLAEGGRTAGLPFLSWGALIDLLSFMVDRIKSLQTALVSAGSQPSDMSTISEDSDDVASE
jgi:hypothetical protein